jgi:lysophospholipid acyltransferase (LPLAT)-like uncharacterized protein
MGILLESPFLMATLQLVIFLKNSVAGQKIPLEFTAMPTVPQPYQSLKTTLLGWSIGQIIRVLGWTIRCRVKLNEDFLEQYERGPVIFVFWHNRILLLPKTYRKYLASRPLSVLTSASKDGAILANVMKCFRMGAVRGSSSKRGAVALVQMKSTIVEGVSMAISPDGPRGPLYQCAPGPIKLAEITEAPMIPISVEYSRAWRLKSWDKFAIPKPFCTADIEFHPPIHVPLKASSDDFAFARETVELALQPREMA